MSGDLINDYDPEGKIPNMWGAAIGGFCLIGGMVFGLGAVAKSCGADATEKANAALTMKEVVENGADMQTGNKTIANERLDTIGYKIAAYKLD